MPSSLHLAQPVGTYLHLEQPKTSARSAAAFAFGPGLALAFAFALPCAVAVALLSALLFALPFALPLGVTRVCAEGSGQLAPGALQAANVGSGLGHWSTRVGIRT